jgi:hypothetical protein
LVILRIEYSYALNDSEELVIGKSAQTDDGAYKIFEAVKREATVAKTGAKSLVAEKTSASVL